MQYAYVWEIGDSVLLGVSETPSSDLRKAEEKRGERARQVFTIHLTNTLSRVVRKTLKRRYFGLSFLQTKELLIRSAIPETDRYDQEK